MKRPSLPKPVIDILTDEEINTLVNSINPNTFLGMRLISLGRRSTLKLYSLRSFDKESWGGGGD